LHLTNAHFQSVVEIEILGVFGEYGGEVPMETHVVAHEHPVADGEGEAHGLVVLLRRPMANLAPVKVWSSSISPNILLRLPRARIPSCGRRCAGTQGFDQRVNHLLMGNRFVGVGGIGARYEREAGVICFLAVSTWAIRVLSLILSWLPFVRGFFGVGFGFAQVELGITEDVELEIEAAILV